MNPWKIIAALGVVAIVLGITALRAGSRAQAAESRDSDRNDGADAAEGSAALTAARELLTSLSERQRKRVSVPFDSDERTRWNYVPMQRQGLPLAAMEPSQRARVDPLLQSALSPEGFAKAKSIIAHEDVLREIERQGGVGNWQRRDPGLFYTTIFAEPTPRAPWAWRFEGHHLSVNVTHLADETQVVAPLFMGSNPARVPSGPQAGLRILAAEEDLGRQLITMLPQERRKRAVIAEQTFSDIVTRNDPKVEGISMQGLPAASMSEQERALLKQLIELYANRMTSAAARDQLARIERAGFDRLHFAWAGSIEPGKPHYYRVHGPTMLIEYDNTQNGANHIHSVWRDLQRDFGGDALRAHYLRHRHDDAHAHTHE